MRITGNIDACIKVYENILFNDHTLYGQTTKHLELVDMYMKKGYFNKAWQYSNRIISQSRGDCNMFAVRRKQFQILKKEKKYDKAFITYCGSIFFSTGETKEQFLRNTKVCANKLDISDLAMDKFAEQLLRLAIEDHAKENELVSCATAFLKTRN